MFYFDVVNLGRILLLITGGVRSVFRRQRISAPGWFACTNRQVLSEEAILDFNVWLLSFEECLTTISLDVKRIFNGPKFDVTRIVSSDTAA